MAGDLHVAWVLDQGGRGGHKWSMAKVICSEAIWRIVDRSVQILRGPGITDDTIAARLSREVRPFCTYDGSAKFTAGRSPAISSATADARPSRLGFQSCLRCENLVPVA